jgi:pyruvate,water dikinase
MMMPQEQRWIYFFGHGQADGGEGVRHLVGGKGASLAEMTRAGLNVPPGFTISAECCDLFHKNQQNWPAGLVEEVQASLQRLEQLVGRRFGRGDNPLQVAVRSGAAHSMPGMMDTVLNVGLPGDHATEPWDMLKDAITAVFHSWNSERAVAYREHHKIGGLLGTAVNVQMMCPAEVSGVLFTENPINPDLGQIIIESSHGLGEAIVLGKVTPDRFVARKDDLAILERHIAVKNNTDEAPGRAGRHTSDAPPAASLTNEQVLELARLGQRVEKYFNYPCDIEWGLAGGQFYLLQARAIRFSGKEASTRQGSSRPTSAQVDDQEREQVRQEEITALKAKAARTGTVWARFNLAEVLPEPTPMTWAIVGRYMSGRGGLGRMYRDLGFHPDPALDNDSTYDLVCGRPYCNLSREPKMQYGNLPFEHKFNLLKADPTRALYPHAVFNPAHAGWKFWFFLPFLFLREWRSSIRVGRLTRTFARDFQEHFAPAFLQQVDAAWAEDLEPLSNRDLLDRLNGWIDRTLFDFARDSLKPTALAAVTMGRLEGILAQRFQPTGTRPEDQQVSKLRRAQAMVRELVMGVKPAGDADLPHAIRDLAAGRLTKADFLCRFGHRGSQEMELARPRWSEDPSAVAALADDSSIRGGADTAGADGQARSWDRIVVDLGLLPNQRTIVQRVLEDVRTYLGLRETAKHYMLRGYALIRHYLLAIDRRLRLEEGVFYLEPEELSRLVRAPANDARLGEEMLALIEKRRRRRQVALNLTAPQVLFSDDLEAIGRDVKVAGADVLQGVPLSAGTVEESAWVVRDSAGARPPARPYILVCPSTDPAWVPLFVKAHGLIMETGGVLSHGAILARELGVPAVAGIADVHRRLQTGQRLRLDGGTGKVTVLQ